MTPSLESIKALIVPFEGRVSHMYLDTVGRVTVGVGDMLPTARAAQVLAFVDRANGQPAAIDDIAEDWDLVSQQARGMLPRYYTQFTALDLPDAEIDRLFGARIDEFTAQLRGEFADFDAFPGPAQLALLDMAFNLGTHALVNKWPRLNVAVAAGDWRQAAAESLRPSANPARNAAIRGLFLDAAQPVTF